MQYDFAVLANQSQTIDIAGRFFKYKSGVGVIRVRASKGGYVDLLPGQGVWGTEFTSLTVTDKTGAANSGVILAGEYDFRDDRIVGQVEVISGERTRTQAGVAFVGFANSSVAGLNYPTVQLWNPPGSGRNLVVGKIIIGTATAQSVRVGAYNVALSTYAIPPQCKRLSGGASIAQPRLSTTELTILIPNIMFSLQVPAGVAQIISMIEPIVVPPGCGLTLVGIATGTDLPTHFEYYEENI